MLDSRRMRSSGRQGRARPPAVAAEHMVATSQGAATRAGLRALDRGGTAADAAIAAAAALCVCEPMSTGIGGDAFAIVHAGGDVAGLDAAGPAAAAAPELPVHVSGPGSVTVPGAVAGWQLLLERHGRLGLDTCLADAIDLAEHGFAVGAMCARTWSAAPEVPDGLPAAPQVGAIVRQPGLARTLRAIAESGPDALYRGPVAEAIAAASALSTEDLAGYAPRWVTPLRVGYRGHEVLELPPPTQGVVALEGLGILERLTDAPQTRERVLAIRLAVEDGLARVRDGADVGDLIDAAYLDARAASSPGRVAEPAGGTVYLCAVDGDGMAVSFIQSLFDLFGSGVVAGDTGVVLQSRGGCFAVEGRVRPGRRPYHTIIPGMLERDGAPVGPFGVMGGFIQAQAHVQFLSAVLDDGLDPQAALDRARFRVDADRLLVEGGGWEEELDGLDLPLERSDDPLPFGGGQAILRQGDALVGASDSRKDGYAAGR
jgi:gamma-glutamyltranspeptidase / glutathione hydrolase